MEIAINNVARTELSLAGSGFLPLSYKPNAKGEIKTGSFAKAIAFASREVRHDTARAMYVKWLSNGTYRPLIQDTMEELVPKSARPFVTAIVPEVGPVSKDMFIQFCVACIGAVDATGKEPKGKKAFFYGICRSVIDSAKANAGEGDVVAEQ